MKDNTIENINEYAVDEAVVKEMPTGVKYTKGVQVGWTAPAKWWNALWGAVTKRLGEIFTTVQSIHEEIKNACGGTLDPSVNTQLKDTLTTMETTLKNESESMDKSLKNFMLSTLLGRVWKKVVITNMNICRFAYHNGIYIGAQTGVGAPGDGHGGLWYSEDGYNWTRITETLDYYFHGGVYYLNNIWIAAAGTYKPNQSTVGGGLWYSEDGRNWVQSNITDETFNDLNYDTIIYGDNKYFACDYYASKVYTSTDGKVWTEIENAPTGSSLITYNGGLYHISSTQGIWYSTDGLNWTQSDLTTSTSNVAYSPCMPGSSTTECWATISNNCVYLSYNGTHWAKSKLTTGATAPITYQAGIWYCKGYYATSPVSWKALSNTGLTQIKYINGTWLGFYPDDNDMYSTGIGYSKDGINWSVTHTNPALSLAKFYLAEDKIFALTVSSGMSYFISDTQTLIDNGWAQL